MANILLIDDDDIFRNMLQTALKRASHQVVAAQSGEEAIRVLTRMQPEVVITDVVMPDRDGLEMIPEMRSLCAKAKIIAVSAGLNMHGVSFQTAAKMSGADLALAKPFPLASMTAAVEKLLAENPPGTASGVAAVVEPAPDPRAPH